MQITRALARWPACKMMFDFRWCMTANLPGIGLFRAAMIAASAFHVPLASSLSSTPSPNHPRGMFWYLRLRKPAFKPPDWVFPLAWTGIETGLATSAYRLLRAASSAARTRAVAPWSANVIRERVDPIASKTAMPLVAWVAFARALTATIHYMTDRR
jgi:tryptophan-rich sensory protein